MKFSLAKKLAKHTVGVGLSFSWDTIGIERMIEDKIVRLWFLGYSIDIDLPFRKQNSNFWVGGFFCLFKKKNSGDTTITPRGEYICIEGLHRPFLLLKQFKYEITLGFQQNKAACRGIFVVSKWLPHPGARVWHVCQTQRPWSALDFQT